MKPIKNTAEAEKGEFPERRTKPRLMCSYPVRLRGWLEGRRVKTGGVVANISSNGVYFFTRQVFEIGDPIFIMVRMTSQPKTEKRPLQIAARGEVVRVELQPDTTCGVALRLDRVRFL